MLLHLLASLRSLTEGISVSLRQGQPRGHDMSAPSSMYVECNHRNWECLTWPQCTMLEPSSISQAKSSSFESSSTFVSCAANVHPNPVHIVSNLSQLNTSKFKWQTQLHVPEVWLPRFFASHTSRTASVLGAGPACGLPPRIVLCGCDGKWEN